MHLRRSATITAVAALTAITLVAACPIAALASDFYVATTGSDATGDGSQANPYLTLQKAIDVAGPVGDTIHVTAGEYDDTTCSVTGKTLTIVGASGVFRAVLTLGSLSAPVLKGDGTNAVLTVAADADVTLSGVAVENAANSAVGPGVQNDGTLTISDSAWRCARQRMAER